MARRALRAALPAALLFLSTPVFAYPQGKAIYVKAGESIQTAINSAHPGDCVTVASGTYNEQLTITTSGITLSGEGAILKPPTAPTSNICSGLSGNNTQAGICVTGSNIKLADFVEEHRKVLSVGSYVEGVSISGFTIRGFTGQNIALVGARNTKVANNILYDGAMYGFLTTGSQNTHAFRNHVAATSDILFIGMCMDDTSPAKYTHNYVSGYLIAYCLQTPDAIVEQNTAENNCVGAFLDPGITGITFSENHISSINPACPPSSPDFVIGGIIIFGASKAKIIGNIVEELHLNGSAVGLVISDSPPSDLSAGNLIKDNIFRDNDLDIALFTNATDNVITHNRCSTPSELCTD